MLRTRIVLTALLLAVSLLAGCDRSAPPAEADLVFVSAADHHFLDPQRMTWLQDVRVARCLFEPLVVLSEDLEVTPGVAESWQLSDDGLTWTFNLREEARWSSGDPVTAGDFVYAWRRAIIPDFASQYSSLFACIEGATEMLSWRTRQIEAFNADPPTDPEQAARQLWEQAQAHFDQTVGISAPDERTLVVRLAQPTPYFLELCAFATFSPVHAASVEEATRLSSTGMLEMATTYWSDPDRLVTNGPYTLARRRPKQDLLLSASPTYWNAAAVRSNTILEKVISEPRTALMLYAQDRVHWLPDIPSASPIASDLMKQEREDVHLTPAAATYFYNFNCRPTLPDGRENPLADARVRRALSMAIDRPTIVDQVTGLGQPVAHSYIPPGTLRGYEPPVERGASFDPEAARALLAEAGYPDGEGLGGLSILYNTEGAHEMTAQQIKHGWEKHLGVVVALEALDSLAFGQRLRNGQFSIARASWFGDYPDATTFLDKFHSEAGNNDPAWQNAEYDALLARASETRDAAARLNLLEQAEALLLSEQPIAPIYHYVNVDLFDPQRVEGLDLNAWKVHRLERVRVE